MSSEGKAMGYTSMKIRADREWKALEELTQPLIHVGMGTCGLAAGAAAVFDAVESTVNKLGVLCRIMRVGCIGMCYAEPMMAIRKPGRPFVYYGDLTPDRAGEIITRYLVDDDPSVHQALCTRGGDPIEGITAFEDLPMLKQQVRIALRNCGLIDPENLDHYIARGGYAGLHQALGMEPEQVIEVIKNSGLRGRGGAGFPTGIKWGLAAKEPGSDKVIICNADEGDPGAFMDRALLEGDPHAVLEGMVIAAYAIGARRGYVYTRAEYPVAIDRLRTALDQMEQNGLLGDDILGSTFDLSITIKEGAGAFVCGEETALIASIQGARGMPQPRPPFPAQSGVHGHPTNINNVETLSNVSAIMERGAEWFTGFGTEKSRGTKTFSLAGNISRPGLIEVPMGIKLGRIIHDIGGGVPGGKALKAVQTGGPSGGCIPPSLLGLPVDYESLAEAGSIMGSGGMVVMDEDTCMVDMARYFLTFTHSESCGKCLPCRLGTGRMLEILEDICEGRGAPEDLELLERLGRAIKNAALCGLGQTAPNPVLTTLRHFRSEYDAHVFRGECPAVVCSAMFRAPCQHACPLGTDVPSYVALVREGRLDDAYEVLLRTNPFPATCGRVCDHVCQAKCRRGTLDEPVGIRHLKRFVTDCGTPRAPSIKLPDRTERIAVIGAGPAGLSAARELRLRGYQVTVFEAMPEAGGMLRYGIPEYRLPGAVLDAEINAILELGITLQTSTRIGQDEPWLKITDRFDAIFLSVGAQASMRLPIPGHDTEGVMGGVEFLRQIRLSGEMDVGERVIAIGGGNVAVDVARSAHRLGARSVKMVCLEKREEMPAHPEEIEETIEEGIEILNGWGPEKIEGNGKVTGVEFKRCTRVFDDEGRFRPQYDGSDTCRIEADTVILAIGQVVELPFRQDVGGIRISEQGSVSIEDGTMSATGNPKVFAGGDAVTGPATVVRAIASGHRAAGEIDASIRLRNEEEPYRVPPVAEIVIPGIAEDGEEPGAQEIMRRLAARDRRRGFDEVALGYTQEQARHESRRCLRCDVQEVEEVEDQLEDAPTIRPSV